MAVNDYVRLHLQKITHSKAYTLFLLNAEDKQFAIYADPIVGSNIQTYVTDRIKPRPFTHDLVLSLINGFEIQIDKIVISDVEDTLYYAKLYVSQDKGELKQVVEIDTRPSDCFTLALMTDSPIFCKRAMLEKVIPI
ncbi:MAG: bifunctional nuclease domain-containing protein [Simkaniaceae bacterium]